MMTEKEMAEFQNWQKQWDLSAEQFAKDYADEVTQSKKQPPTSWLTGTPLDRDYQEKDVVVDPAWNDINYLANFRQNNEELLTESQVKYDKGEESPKAAWGAFTPTKTNPTQQSTVGADQEGPDGLRVTSNWSDSDDLRELDDIKRRLEEMERKHHEAEVKSEKASPRLKKQLDELRIRIKNLSERINKEPKVDVT